MQVGKRRSLLGEMAKCGERNPHLISSPTTKIFPHPPTAEIDLANAQLTGIGGWSLLTSTAHQSGLLDQLAEAVQVKKRQRGASDAQVLWALILWLAAGNGALSDFDAALARRIRLASKKREWRRERSLGIA